MADFEIVVSIVGFIIVSHLVLVTGGGGEFLFELPSDVEPPQLVPEPPDSAFVTVDLEEDVFSSENITFVDSDTLTDPAVDSSYVAVLESGSDSGTVTYNTPGIRSLNVEATQDCGSIFTQSRVELTAEGESPVRLCGREELVTETDSVNFVTFEFLPSSEGGGTPRLYTFEYSTDVVEGDASGVLGGLETLGEIALYPVRLWGYFEHFPFYIKTFYGLLLTYLSIVIVRGL